MTKKFKRPKVSESPTTRKEPKVKSVPFDLQEVETIAWRFSIVDLDGPWGWETTARDDWWEKIFPKLKHIDSMTWAEIAKATGGRRVGNNHHPVEVRKLTQQAKQRLKEIRQDDVSELFSLRLDSTTRIYGIRDRRALKLLWYDPYHGCNSKAVYPVKKN